MKVFFINSTLDFKKSLPLLSKVEFVSVYLAGNGGIRQGTAAKGSCYVYDARNCNKIIVDGVKIRDTVIGYFYTGEVPTENMGFPSGNPEVLQNWLSTHHIVVNGRIIASNYGYENGDVIQNVELNVPENATMFIVWYKSTDGVDTVTVLKKE